ncbi:acetyl-CoA carboxylase, biotin carboxylase subunit [Spizellomyces punctatus DAOM BR117]|uniref:Acetyl-CoA carboxylase, biotin carboxylase subunit n=1 Tax=Spizellomyces punctatus (strain DAOM BR117) TaxID=645134 RepID=A0A0L0H5J2_SPIPD|nr:acetyl-CoA carboxylase, biotin carboxylase subunit [Spizellomyces punctatus DAOM BR117]KNC96487.1 acetyl-CoA carboxylase, biotin carboxylase subunit [Spizellomyces punctatus DAOM BR117]|eukprot:XP_016604527.1 acetyl-CoA carboxylase, biotin carboxylase subunit [Spizellomyces punctatus DAOM BR117]
MLGQLRSHLQHTLSPSTPRALWAQCTLHSRRTSMRALATSTDYGKTFDKILIANRGEIACRVIKTARKMGIKTVAIYSDADANSLHVRMADEAVHVGPPATSKSYLNIPNIIGAIKQTGAQAVHPGYGFLSENSHFVHALDEIGCTFIGPNEKAMAAMGDKIQSKIFAHEARVSTIPGFNGVVQNADHAVEIAKSIGYPVMIKASAGGGGKGMRIAWNDQEARDAFKISSSEALSSFGDDRLLVEKFVEHPRHIEIQLIGDKHGNVIYLPERECSIQRRNQKVIEEAPSVHIDQATRKAMGEQAVALAKAVGYYSAGTCEFLVDPKRNFYFLEMNTRLQVEHPITEYITGLDLVEQMIRVAAGQQLGFKQSDVKINGWAFESRVYAEDPEKYLPSIGTLNKYIEPKGKGDEVRCDSGIIEGSEISIYYDPLICKLCTHGATRDEAMKNMEKALDEYVIKGVTHNIPLLRDVISHPRFVQGKLSTAFLAEEYPKGFKGHRLTEQTREELVAAAALAHAKRDLRNRTWVSGGGPLTEGAPQRDQWDLFVGVGADAPVPVTLKRNGDGSFLVDIDGKPVTISADWPLESPILRAALKTPEGTSRTATLQYLESHPLGYKLAHHGTKFDVVVHTALQNALSKHMKEKPKLDLTRMILAPMPGSVVSVAVKEGDTVAEGAELAVVEAMKMQNVLRAPRVGKISKVFVQAGQSVAGDEVMIEFFGEEEVKKAA